MYHVDLIICKQTPRKLLWAIIINNSHYIDDVTKMMTSMDILYDTTVTNVGNENNYLMTSSFKAAGLTAASNNITAMQDLRVICDVYISMPISIAGILGNILTLIVLSNHKQVRRCAYLSNIIIGLSLKYAN